MHLSSLTLKGFKSFASATTLRFEPGITCVVGPNGSGKSNVVDALAWVMGEQGAKSLRGGRMEDVIFAGTAGRPPLGRAEVSLTIDNADGALPTDFSEVTITRTMFRGGGSDYTVNGQPCRLLDVQELLSDSGIGREMHVIVGQGQLDAVLAASPEERRGLLEEAAGVLKHRRRREKALRKLDATSANVTRLQDLTAELRRQLRPLGKQAEVARRAATVQADLRDARLRLLADDLVQLAAAAEAEIADETVLRQRRAEVEAALAEATQRQGRLEATLSAQAPALARASETWYRLRSMRDRIEGTAGLAAERLRLSGDAVPPEHPGPDPADLEQQAVRVRAQESDLAGQLQEYRQRLQAAVAAREAAEEALTAEEGRIAVATRAAADRREGLARLAGQVSARRSRVEAGEAELGRLRAALHDVQARAARDEQEFAALESRIAGLDAGEEGLDAAYEDAASRLAHVDERLARLREEERDAERERAAATARRDALEVGLAGRDGAGALLAANGRLPGLLGSVAALVTVDAGYEAAIAAALGAAADAVAVTGPAAAAEAIALLKEEDAGRAAVLVAGPGGAEQGGGRGREAPDHRPRRPALPGSPDARPALDVVRAAPALQPVLRRLLRGVHVVATLADARTLVESVPGVVAVSREGDVLGAAVSAGGSSSTPSRLEVQAAVDEAAVAVDAAAHRGERLRFEAAAVERERSDAAKGVEVTLERLHESDARLAAVAEALGQLGAAARAASAEGQRLSRGIATAEEALRDDRAGLGELENRLAAAGRKPGEEPQPSTQGRESLATACATARHAELEARLAVRTVEERARALLGRADALEQAAREGRAARARAVEQWRRRAQETARAAAVRAGCARVLPRLDASLADAAAEREAAEQAREAAAAELVTLRQRVGDLARELEELVSSVHRDEVARAEQRLRIEAVQRRAVEELGIDPATLVDEYGPHRPVARPDGEETPYVRAEQEKRLRAAERDLALLGRVNPLALEEFAALEERHAFLGEALEDLRATRRDLLDIVREVDERVEEAVTAAFHDTARQFEEAFARLFPGGEGRLVLTDPGDMLATGIEVEARPAGKKVKRLSLLSGGERSLAAVALLLALFKARPSPFYVLDEVEAALDDVNLDRLLVLLEELRASSQLLVITHQKRTMEIADALYGTSMRGDGVTTVIGQRLRESESA